MPRWLTEGEEGMTLSLYVQPGAKRTEVVPGVSRDGYTAVTPLEPLPQHAEFASDKVYYLWSILENSEHDDRSP